MLAAGCFDMTWRDWLAGAVIVHLLLKRGTAARDPLLDADMMCGYVCVSLFVGQEKCAIEKQPSKSDPWSSFGGASHELPKRVLGPELFLDVREKGTYLAGRAGAFCDWPEDTRNSGSPSSRSALQKSLTHGRLLALLSLPLSSLQARILIPRPVPTPRTSCHLHRAQSKPPEQPFFR